MLTGDSRTPAWPTLPGAVASHDKDNIKYLFGKVA